MKASFRSGLGSIMHIGFYMKSSTSLLVSTFPEDSMEIIFPTVIHII